MNRLFPLSGRLPRAALVGLICLCSAARAAAQGPTPLGLEEAAALAVQHQPQLLAQQAAIAALDASAPAAGELPDPKLRVGLASLPIDTFAFTQEAMTQATLGVSQAIPGGAKRHLAEARVEREAAQDKQALAASTRRIKRDAQLAWLDLYWPSQAQALVEQVADEYRRQVEWSEVAYKTGKLSQEETLALRGMLETTLDRLAELDRQKAKARAGLARWIGTAAERPVQALPPADPPAPLQELVAQLQQHPELATLNEAVRVAQADVDLAKEAYKPDWSVDLSYGLRGGSRPDFISVGVGVDLPIFPGKRQDKRLAARLSGVERVEQLRNDRYLALQSELESAYADWQAADARSAHFERDILPLAQRRGESALAAYGSDRASYGRVLEVRRAELEVRLQWLAQQVARARAMVQIRYFSGQ
jgi:cobalt-zinc-cadmium efflux system outer membrane protein